MSDLSWLNPTPHAIAVYASQPLSPVATQHSLPSGRYSLLGPDFHRLDRTSFAWRTHSITSSARASRTVMSTILLSATDDFESAGHTFEPATPHPSAAWSGVKCFGLTAQTTAQDAITLLGKPWLGLK